MELKKACPVVCNGTCLFVYIYILLEIQVTEAVGLLGLPTLFRLSDSFSPPALQVLVHRAVPGSGALSPAAEPPRQSGTAVCEMIVLNKCPDQEYQKDCCSDPQYPEKYLDHIDKYHSRTAGGRIFFPGSCRLCGSGNTSTLAGRLISRRSFCRLRSFGAVRLLRRRRSFCRIRCP